MCNVFCGRREVLHDGGRHGGGRAPGSREHHIGELYGACADVVLRVGRDRHIGNVAPRLK